MCFKVTNGSLWQLLRGKVSGSPASYFWNEKSTEHPEWPCFRQLLEQSNTETRKNITTNGWDNDKKNHSLWRIWLLLLPPRQHYHLRKQPLPQYHHHHNYHHISHHLRHLHRFPHISAPGKIVVVVSLRVLFTDGSVIGQLRQRAR